ncbi:hypothetical protein M378DRAFT_171931 [Amanita muscaria Koide BX008]|uniref:Uncharacterized protein n=1 Tax=Amanita muscaria (strain Koide BX008) TaxID=946122 RepID=A0A0C2WM34_AMAMK|nr:hypothetical protein M378DRAFT_171931 [Amanita muscaria Koide BX008]
MTLFRCVQKTLYHAMRIPASSNKDQSAVSVSAIWFVGQHIKPNYPPSRVHIIMKFSASALCLWLAVVGAVKLSPARPSNFGFVPRDLSVDDRGLFRLLLFSLFVTNCIDTRNVHDYST